MENRIKKTMADVFDVDESSISEESSTETVENWDSLRHMNLVLALEQEFGVQFNDEQIPELTSFKLIKESLKDLVKLT